MEGADYGGATVQHSSYLAFDTHRRFDINFHQFSPTILSFLLNYQHFISFSFYFDVCVENSDLIIPYFFTNSFVLSSSIITIQLFSYYEARMWNILWNIYSPRRFNNSHSITVLLWNLQGKFDVKHSSSVHYISDLCPFRIITNTETLVTRLVTILFFISLFLSNLNTRKIRQPFFLSVLSWVFGAFENLAASANTFFFHNLHNEFIGSSANGSFSTREPQLFFSTPNEYSSSESNIFLFYYYSTLATNTPRAWLFSLCRCISVWI